MVNSFLGVHWIRSQSSETSFTRKSHLCAAINVAWWWRKLARFRQCPELTADGSRPDWNGKHDVSYGKWLVPNFRCGHYQCVRLLCALKICRNGNVDEPCNSKLFPRHVDVCLPAE